MCEVGVAEAPFSAFFFLTVCSPKQNTLVCVCVCVVMRSLHIPPVPHRLALTSFTTLTNQCPVITSAALKHVH